MANDPPGSYNSGSNPDEVQKQADKDEWMLAQVIVGEKEIWVSTRGFSTTTGHELGLAGVEWMRRQYYQGSNLTGVHGVLPENCKRKILGEIVVFDSNSSEAFRQQVEVSGPQGSTTDPEICKEVCYHIASLFKRGRTAPTSRKRRRDDDNDDDNDDDDGGNKKRAARNTHASAVMPDQVESNEALPAAADDNEEDDEDKKPPADSNPASEAMPDQVGSAAVAESSNSAFQAVPDPVASAGKALLELSAADPTVPSRLCQIQ